VKSKIANEIRFIAVNYIIAPSLGILVCLLEAFGRIKFVHFNRFPIWEEKLIIVSNHPSLLEPFLLPLMGFPWMNFPWVFSPLRLRVKFSLRWLKELRKELSRPKRLIPANVPDKGNFYDPLWMRVLQVVNIPVVRNGSTHGRIATISALVEVLENGGRVLIFPEGTRTYKAVKNPGGVKVNGQELGKLRDGAAWLALKTNAKILPVWVEGTDRVLPNNKFPLLRLWHKVTIRIGDPLAVDGKTRGEATTDITNSLLKLAGEKVGEIQTDN
jgi:1-acyl-sn-glycerol-3-phosphate acyltransferase